MTGLVILIVLAALIAAALQATDRRIRRRGLAPASTGSVDDADRRRTNAELRGLRTSSEVLAAPSRSSREVDQQELGRAA